MNVFQMILAFLNTNPLQNFRVTQPKAAPKANHLLLLLPIISEQKAKGLGGGWKARWPRVIIHYLVSSSSSNSSGAKITAEHDKGSRSSRVNMVAEHAISRALYLGSAAPHFPSNCSLFYPRFDFGGCATHEEYFEIDSLLLEAKAVQDMWTYQPYSFYV